jgi:hypothetical protein
MEIVDAFACSHAGLIYSRVEEPTPAQRDAVYAAFDRMREAIEQTQPDAIVIVATDHQGVFPLSGVPMFAIGVGPTAAGIGDAGVPPCSVAVHQPLAQAVLEGCVARGIDLVFCEEVKIDHSFVCPLTFVTPQFDVPIVPIVENCNVPPRPTLRRSHEVGGAIRESILEGPPGRAVVIGTGGLSHWVGGDDRIEFMNRPAGTRMAEIAEHPIHIADRGRINDVFDRNFLDALAQGGAESFVEEWSSDRVEEEAGNGAHEIRNWILAAGMAGDAPLETLAYEPVEEWLTGTAVARFLLP